MLTYLKYDLYLSVKQLYNKIVDTLSHALWGKGFFGYRGKPYWSLFFGALPDLFSFGIYFLLNTLFNSRNFEFGKPEFDQLPDWLFELYNISHSLFIAFIAVALIYFKINRNFAFAMLAWPLHIIIDFPFHTADFFPTPILWPIKEVRFDGIAWSNPYVWFSNIGGLIIIYSYRIFYKK